MTDVLIVEDDAGLANVLAELLRDEGWSVDTALDGREALEHMRSAASLPRIVLLDLMMPIVDGWVMRELMLDDPLLHDVPVVVFSSVDLCRKDERELRAAAVFAKPPDLESLFAIIAAHCGPANLPETVAVV
jgi:CheY-like chemotaxis protein